MDFRPDDDLALLAATADAFLAGLTTPERLAAASATDAGFDRDGWGQMAAMGWTALASTDPAERLPLGVIVEALGRAGLSSPLRESTGSCGTLLALLPDASDNVPLAPAVAEGATVAALVDGTGRPGAARVVWRPRGDGGTLAGAPRPVDWGTVAAQFVCVAEDERGRTVVAAVDADGPGVVVEPVPSFDDERPAMVTLDHARARVLAAPTGALDGALDDARALRLLLRTAELLGGAEAVLSMTVEHVKERQQFGRAIGSFQAVRHACADMATVTEGMRLTAYEALWRAAVGLPFRRQAAAAVVFGARSVDIVLRWGSQLHGGVGFMSVHPLSRFYRHLKAGQVRLGTPSELTAWATPLLLTPSIDRSPVSTSDLELLDDLDVRMGGSRS